MLADKKISPLPETRRQLNCLQSMLTVKNVFRSSLGRLRLIAFAEGISFLILLFIAMPLKYALNYPDAVRYFGMAHGVLFVGYVFLVMACHLEYRWRFSKTLALLLLSVIPFGNFYADKRYLRAPE